MPRPVPIRSTVGTAAPLLAVACIAGLDAIARTRSWPIPVAALLDEPAHLLTAAIVLSVVPGVPRRIWPWALLGAVAIDVDHIPLYLWGEPVTSFGGRPVTHSLATVVALLAVAVAFRRARTAAVGLSVGVLLHLLRDLATGPGVPLLWPVRPENVLLPHWSYLILLTVLALIAVGRQVRRTRLARTRRTSATVSQTLRRRAAADRTSAPAPGRDRRANQSRQPVDDRAMLGFRDR